MFIINWLRNLWIEYKMHRAYKKKIKELKSGRIAQLEEQLEESENARRLI